VQAEGPKALSRAEGEGAPTSSFCQDFLNKGGLYQGREKDLKEWRGERVRASVGGRFLLISLGYVVVREVARPRPLKSKRQ